MELELGQLDRRYESLRTRSARRERRLLSSLSEIGQQTPILVVRDASPSVSMSASVAAERWVLVDGYKRVRALKRLGHDVVRAAAWELGEVEALVLERALRGGDAASAIEEGWLLRELMQRFGLGLEELARRFDRSRSWASRRLGLVTELPAAVQEQVRAGAIGAHAAMKYLVPLARANASDCEALGRTLGKLRPTSRDVSELYAAYMAGNAVVRERVVQQPGLVLKARAELSRTGDKLSGVEQLVHDLRVVASVARRAQRRLGEGALDGASEAERHRAREECHEARFEMERVARRFEQEAKEMGHARSDDQGGNSPPA
jgi:ParB-like chromosome segregation protein Spo0J